MARPKHSKGDVEKVLKAAEKAGCRITGGGRTHYRIYPPGGDRIVTVSSSPSTDGIAQKVRKELCKSGVALK